MFVEMRLALNVNTCASEIESSSIVR